MNRLGKEDFYKMGIVFSLFFIIVIIVLVFVYKKEVPEEIIEEENTKFVSVTDYNLFFFVNKNINNFINYTVTNNTDAILNILDNDYKQEKNLNPYTLFNTIKFYKENDRYEAIRTKSFPLNENTEVYYTEGRVVNEGYNETTVVNQIARFLLYVDFENMAISLTLLDNALDENKFIMEANKDKRITLNASNRIEQIDVIDYTTICSMYLSDFIWKVYNNTNEAFSLQTNFSSLGSFENFINQNNITSEIKSCSQTNENGKRVYQMVDRNDYKYTFTEENILDYRVSVNK